MDKEKTVYDLALHESLKVKNGVGGDIEITRVPGGWVYAFDYPGIHQCPVVFIPFCVDPIKAAKKINGNKKEN